MLSRDVPLPYSYQVPGISFEMEKQPETIPLIYTIAGCSEHSGRYNPENIMVDNPQDQNSRWSGAYQAFNSKQWVLLRLDQLCLLS